MKRWQRTLNLICWVLRLRLIRAAAQSHVSVIAVNSLGMRLSICFLGFLEPETKPGGRTRGILPAADLDELLDVGDFARHYGGSGRGWREAGSRREVLERDAAVVCLGLSGPATVT